MINPFCDRKCWDFWKCCSRYYSKTHINEEYNLQTMWLWIISSCLCLRLHGLHNLCYLIISSHAKLLRCQIKIILIQLNERKSLTDIALANCFYKAMYSLSFPAADSVSYNQRMLSKLLIADWWCKRHFCRLRNALTNETKIIYTLLELLMNKRKTYFHWIHLL